MSLLLLLLLVTFGLILLLLVTTFVLQGYFYTQPTDGLLWRSAAAGGVLGGFIAFWCYLDTRSPGRYDTLFDFTNKEVFVFDEFDSISKMSNGTEKSVHYKRFIGPRGEAEFRDSFNNPWKRSTGDSMVVAIEVTENGEKKRFNTVLENGRFKEPLEFREEKGSRAMNDAPLGTAYAYRSGVLLVNLFLNFFLGILAFVAVWLLLRFDWFHALGIALSLWGILLLLLMPVLFTRTRAPIAAPPALELRDR